MSTTTNRSLLAVLTLVCCDCFCVAKAGSFDAIYAFGDSLTDVGNIYAATGGLAPAAPYVNGQFSNGNVWVQDLAADLGLAPLKASLLGGTDYAYGGAESGVTSFNTVPADIDLTGTTGQLAQYSSTHASADPNALYTIWIGANDLKAILGTSPTSTQAAADADAVVANIDSAIDTLSALGAKNFLIVGVPDLGKTPSAIADGPAGVAASTELSAYFDGALLNGGGGLPSLASLATQNSIHLSFLNTYSVLDSIVANPAAYGLTNVTSPCLTGAVNYSGGTVCSTPSQYLFWDDLHPTAAGHAIIASAALATLPVPEPPFSLLIAIGALGLLLARRHAWDGRIVSHLRIVGPLRG